ncbi:iron chelate uptake ABC transporter family permease subunit [Vagococcus xieshaowenii]|uniref:Iron ABC transporter permease n=1 Tax=Vagococcus xieshaowenii TaxID=2562451 RepID=A0AAJ5JKV2_9ENTE|nr:iron chelate uptake ABC transporter family permease subunit [Vagococcus xieshaowenii]QCA28687.1 iron ABC transporter permease [Vagococcus xieshaowenii]TFZ40505.1 iron ABC transporter permease [Vagococcus xieshaowenii]
MPKTKERIIWLSLISAVVLMSLLFLTYNTYGNWSFALNFRGKKLLAFIFVGIATSFATISFQTLANNHFLTPSILGFDSLYTLIHTGLFFFMGEQAKLSLLENQLVMFVVNVSLMIVLSTSMFYFLLKKQGNNLYLLLMVGMILGTLFGSVSTFLQVLLDPNEFDKLQGKLFASFANVNTTLLTLAFVFLMIGAGYLWLSAKKMDVLHLGKDVATNLGINVGRFQWQLLFVISLLVAVSTALVGPITFLGFIVANISYQLFNTYKHRILFIGSSLLAILLLIGGQFLVEQVFKWNTTLSVVIEFTGGVYFVGKLLRERK